MAAPSPTDILLLTNADGEILKDMRKAAKGSSTRGPISSRVSSASEEFIWIRITGHTQDGSNKRWKYDWVEIRKTAAGFGGWTTVTNGRSGHGSDFDYAYNTVEDANGSSGTYGNGVVSTDLSGTLDIQPITTSVPVRAWIVYPDANNSNGYPCQPELHFSLMNGITGSCS